MAATTAKTPVREGRKDGLTNNRWAYESMQKAIVRGRLLPGAKVNILGCAQDLGVSSGAVREALAMLDADGLVVATPQRGYRVSSVSTEDMVQLAQARIRIENLCLAESLEHGDLLWESSVVAAFHRLSRLNHRDAADATHMAAEWADAHACFHDAVVAACPNQWLLRIHTMLYKQSERYRQLSVPMANVERDVPGEHRILMEAVIARDIGAAQRMMTVHLDRTTQLIATSSVLSSTAG